MMRRTWHTEDFDAMGWHDVHVHGLKLENFSVEEGSCDLVLDIDYLLQWDTCDDGMFRFTVCRAELRFHQVRNLKLALDYASTSAGMCPFSIHGIQRETLRYINGATSWRWQITINWPLGSLQLDAPGFTQTLMGEPVVQQSRQWLSSAQRTGTF
ncbi:MAG: hypothetical protein LBQ20_00150 [Rhodanobacter sp.]|nr:hypothetical protein [Rhodanobacter sp.]